MGPVKAHFEGDFDTFSVEIGSVFENGFCPLLLRFGGEHGGQVYPTSLLGGKGRKKRKRRRKQIRGSWLSIQTRLINS